MSIRPCGWLVCVMACLIAGCAGYPPEVLKPGVAKRADVIKRMGSPTRVLKQPDGGELLEFSDQPHSGYCFMIDLDPAGNVRSVVDALSKTGRQRVQRAMKVEDLERMFCAPASKDLMPRTGEIAWEWVLERVRGNTNGLHFVIYIRDGRVVRTQELVIVEGSD